ARRIRNSIHLLIQADKQSKHAIGLALCVACIEALICKDSPNLTKMFAENVAGLLEPKLEHRTAAEQFATQLYRQPSKILHGDETDLPHARWQHARMLAAAVMKAFVERRLFRRRYEEDRNDETPEDLLKEMRQNKYASGQVFGVQESRVTELWRN